MFYYPNVLQRHTGCFSTVWLAATKGSRIVKREYLKVNVIKTCQKIVQYILQQVPPPYRGSPIPRLSLYLSAQLSYGVVCVYHRQCDLLIEEVKTTLERLYKVEKLAKIDLLHTEQHLLLPDNLILMQMLEDAPNPFFGMMEIPPELPEPTMIPQLSLLLETSGPEIVRLEKTPRRDRRGRRAEDTSHLTSPELITMQEVEPAPLPLIEINLHGTTICCLNAPKPYHAIRQFGQDLPEVSALDLELLMSDLPSLPEVETLPEPGKRRPKDIKDVKAKPKEPKRERDPARSVDVEEEKRLEELAIEADSIKQELQEREKEVTRLKEERRQTELQQEYEREAQRKEDIERKKSYRQEVEREMERLHKAIRELKRLQSMGAAEEFLLEKQEEIRDRKKLQKESRRQWEAEKHEQQLKVEEREREYRKEREQVMQRLREAEQEIERLKQTMAEQALDERSMEPAEKMRKIEERVDEKYKSETEGSPVRSPAKLGLPSEVLSELNAAALLDEAAEQDLFPEGALSPVPVPPHVSPPHSSPQLMLPEVPHEVGALPAVRRAVRKTTLIVDKVTQIGSKTMQEQTRDPHIYTQPVVPVTIPSMKPQTPASLFESPTYQKFMAPELRELWSRCALSEPLQYIHEREEEFVSELEEVRAVTESGVSIMVPSEFSLELVSEEERSRPSMLTPEERRSFSAQDERVLPMVSEMPELIVELPETEEVELSDIQRKLHSEIESAAHSEFLSLTPRSLSRLLVSRFFFSCLVLCTQGDLHLQQSEPYGRIDITPGRNYPQD